MIDLLTPEQEADLRSLESWHQDSVDERVWATLDAERAENEDFCRAWAILKEPLEEMRGAETAAEVATRFRALLDAARAENERLKEALRLAGDAFERQHWDGDCPACHSLPEATACPALLAVLQARRAALNSTGGRDG